MARQRNLRQFYVGLGVLAVVGLGAVVWAGTRRPSAGAQILDAPVPVGTAAFPGYVLGSDSAPVEIVEYADFQCPACASFAILSGPDIKQRLVASGLVRWRFRDFPISSIHDKTLVAHHAAACADEQDRFWEFHDQLFFNQRSWAESRRPLRQFRDYARAAGINLEQFDHCMDEQRYAARIIATRDELAALGVGSTPTFDIGRLRVTGSLPYDSVRALVELAANAVNP